MLFSFVTRGIVIALIIIVVGIQAFQQRFVRTHSRTVINLKWRKEHYTRGGSIPLKMNSDEAPSPSAHFEDVLDHEFPLHKEPPEECTVPTNSSLEIEEQIVDPRAIAIRELEKNLTLELHAAKALLTKEQSALFDIQEKMFSSGKNGYFLVKSQINDFIRKMDADQKVKVESNKKKLVSKILPLLDLFRSIPQKYPPTTDREKKMHEDFKVLVRSIIIALQKYGYSEFSPAIDDIVDEAKHEIVELLDSSAENDENHSYCFVVSILQPGIVDAYGNVARKAQVHAAKRRNNESSE